jgi:FG-GAP repeat
VNNRRLRAITAIIGLATATTGMTVIGTTASQAAARSPIAASAHHGVSGDFDGDGRRDLAVGAPGGNRVRVTYTKASPGGSHVQWLAAPEAFLTRAGDFFGTSLAVGDFNGDGFTDLAVGAPEWTDPAQVESQGAVYIYDGGKTGLHYSGLALHGPFDGDDPFNLGGALAATDINHDGFADLALTVYGGDDQDVHVLYGSAAGLSTTGEQFFDDSFVGALAFGDVNHDGHPDLVMGSTIDLDPGVDESVGRVDVIFGHAGGLSSTGRQTISGNEVGVKFGLGASVAVGDINHDGYADVVVGDPAEKTTGANYGGKILVFFGGKHGISKNHFQTIRENSGHLTAHARRVDLFGESLSIGRLAGNTYPDVVVGAPGVRVNGHKNAGAVYVLRGTKNGLTTVGSQRLTQASPGVPSNPQNRSGFGSAVHLALLGPRHTLDLVVTAPGASVGVPSSGLYAILRSSGGRIVTSHANDVEDSTAKDGLGAAVAG